MMEVKGAGVVCLPKFVKAKFGGGGFQKWIDSLPEEAKKIHNGQLLASVWYPLEIAGNISERKIIELFYDNDPRSTAEIGRFAADETLKGIYKAFVKLGSPSFLISKTTSITSTFFKPSKMEAKKIGPTSSVMYTVEFSEMTDILEWHIQGYAERALEICGAKNVKVEITKSVVRGDQFSEWSCSWD